MGKLVNGKGEVRDSFIADSFIELVNHDVLGTVSLQQAESIILLMAENHDKGFKAGKEYTLTPEYAEELVKEEQAKINKAIQRHMNILNGEVDY